MTTWRHPHGEHVGHRWRDPKALANKDGWWPDRDTDPTPTTTPPPRLPRGVRDNLSDQKGQTR